MKKRIFCTVFTLLTLMIILTQSVFAETFTKVITPEYTEDTVVAISFKDGQKPGGEYIYTGEKIKPEIIVKKVDKTVADPSEYKVTYDDDCHETGLHFVSVEYLKSGYKVTMDYYVVPGTTKRVDMTAKNGQVTLSWASVKGANCYRVYEYNSSKGRYVEIPWENGSIAAPRLSRTFSNLQAGKTYDMAIMALEKIGSMPTKQMKTFKFTVPANDEGSFNIIPGINEPTKVTTTKPTTTIKVTEKIEATTATLTTEVTTTESTTLIETTSQTETKPSVIETTIANSPVVDTPENDSDTKIIIPIIVAGTIVIAAVVAFVIIKKKKK